MGNKSTPGTRPGGVPALPAVPAVPRVPTMLDPAFELTRIMEQRKQATMKGLGGTALTSNLGGAGGTPRTELTGR